MKYINTDELKTITESLGENDLVLDVRTDEEYAEGHIKGSLLIMHEEVGTRTEDLKKYDHIYIVCRSGKRAQIAAGVLEASGFSNLTCCSQGGMMEWGEKGYPTDK